MCVRRFRVPLRRAVLRGAPVQRQARLLLRLPGARRAGDPPQQPRRRLPEDTQDLNQPLPTSSYPSHSLSPPLHTSPPRHVKTHLL